MGMKLGSLLIAFLLLASSGAAQDISSTPSVADTLPPFQGPEWRLGGDPQVGAIGDLSVNSSGLTADFYRPFIRGGHIDEDLKKSTIEGMEEEVRFGGDRILSLGGSFRPDSLFGEANRKRTVFIRLIDGRHYHARFTRDLFRTIFIGNPQDGRRAEFAPFRMNSMRYRQFKIGVLDQRGKFEMGIAISGFQGRSDLRIGADNAYLEGEADGSELRFRLNGELLQQGRGEEVPFWRMPGSGVGIDILGGYDFGRFGQVRMTFKNMGLVHWGPSARIRQVDTTASFEGFSFDNPFQGSTTGPNAPIEELEERYLPEERSGAYRRPFPGKIRLAYAKRFPSGVWFRSSFLHRPVTSHVPYWGLEVMKAWDALRAGISVGHGGFGEFAFGTEAAYRFGEHWDLYIRAPHLEGLIFPGRSGGFRTSVGLHYRY